MNPKEAIEPLPPHSPEAERGVLGCVLLEPRCLAQGQDRFGTDKVFYDLRHAAIYGAMEALALVGSAGGPEPRATGGGIPGGAGPGQTAAVARTDGTGG